MVFEVGDTRALNVITKLHQAPSPALRFLVAGLLLVLAFAGAVAVADYKTVTLSVDGNAMTVATMKSRVIDIITENGFQVSDRDDLYPAAGEKVHNAANIVLRVDGFDRTLISGELSREPEVVT